MTFNLEIVDLVIFVASPIIGYFILTGITGAVKKHSMEAYIALQIVYNLIMSALIGYGVLSALRIIFNNVL